MSLADYSGGSQIASSVQSGSSQVYNGITSVQNYINGVGSTSPSTGQYVLIPPKGSKGGIAGFVFDYYGDDEMELTSEITDHFAEDNSSVQDHIALLPYRVTLRGFVSELILPAPSQGLFGALTTLQQKLGTTSAYLGKYTPQAVQKLQGQISGAVSQVQNYANEASQYLNQAKNIAALFGGSAAATKQQSAFVTLASLRDQRQIFSVLTPWVFLSGMAIESLIFVQPKESVTKTDITVTMKQMRFVDVQSSTQSSQAMFQGRAATSYQPLSNLGSTPGVQADVTSLNLPAFQPF